MGDHDEPRGIARADDVPDVDLAQSEPSADRRGDARVGQLQLRAFDLRLVGLQRSFVLPHQRDLRVELLLGDRVLREQHRVALDVGARIGNQRLVLRHLSFGLRELHLERTRIDLGEHVTGLHHLSLAECDPHQLAVDARAHDRRVRRCHRTERAQEDIHRPRLRFFGDHRQRPVAGAASALAIAALLRAGARSAAASLAPACRAAVSTSGHAAGGIARRRRGNVEVAEIGEYRDAGQRGDQ